MKTLQPIKKTTSTLSRKLELHRQITKPSIDDFSVILDSIREPILILDIDFRVVKANCSFYRTFKVGPEETEGTSVYDLGNRQWDIPRLRELLEKILPDNSKFDDFEVEHTFATIGRKIMRLNACRIERETTDNQLIFLAIEDVTDRVTHKKSS